MVEMFWKLEFIGGLIFFFKDIKDSGKFDFENPVTKE
jgi:hypothetical protein